MRRGSFAKFVAGPIADLGDRGLEWGSNHIPTRKETTMANSTFDSNVRARTRAAAFMQSDPQLLAAFVAQGGMQSDLLLIVEAGMRAEAANLAQSGRMADGKAATVDVTRRFAALMREYKSVMAVLRAVLRDLKKGHADVTLIEQVAQVLVDETEVSVAVTPNSDGTKAVKVRKSATQDAIRAEIYRDAATLAGLTGVHEALGSRQVPVARLQAMAAEAEALQGLLATRVAKKAERKGATAEVYEAVNAQREAWNAVSRLMARVDDPRVRALLRDTRR